MRDRAQTKIRIDEIPAELCTRQEAAQILGLKYGADFTTSKRFKSLPYSYVVYKGKRIVLYNRKAVEALKYEPCPSGWVSAKEACKMLGYTVQSAGVSTAIRDCMDKYGFKPKMVKAHHSYLVWKREDVEKVKKMREKCKKK